MPACTRPAVEWALIHGRETVSEVRTKLAFSVVLEDYIPLCRKCHRRYDGNAQTMWDRDHEGRTARQAWGAGHGMVKLTEIQVAEIVSRRGSGEVLRAIAQDYGVSMAQISRIALGQSWNRKGSSK